VAKSVAVASVFASLLACILGAAGFADQKVVLSTCEPCASVSGSPELQAATLVLPGATLTLPSRTPGQPNAVFTHFTINFDRL